MYYCKNNNINYYQYNSKHSYKSGHKLKKIDFWKISTEIFSYLFSTILLGLFLIFGYLYLTKQSSILSNQIKYVLSVNPTFYSTKYPSYLVKSQKTPLKKEEIARIDKILTPCTNSDKKLQRLERKDKVDKVRTITVKRGDTLYTLAERAYGDASYYRLIFDANPKKLKSKRDLHIGQILRIPF